MSALAVMEPAGLIQLAIEKGADVDRLSALMDLEERYRARLAVEGFNEARSAFQAQCPDIPKTKEVKNRDGSVRYRFAPLDQIMKRVAPSLQSNGLSYRWETEKAEDGVSVICYLTHRLGHESASRAFIPAVTGHGTNAAQDEGSAISYGKRYSFCNALGLQPDEDDDGTSAAVANSEFLVHHNNVAREWLTSILAIKEGLSEDGDMSAAAEAYAELTLPALRTLNVAPSKGGLFTTEERKTFKSNKEFQELVTAARNSVGWHDDPQNQL